MINKQRELALYNVEIGKIHIRFVRVVGFIMYLAR